MRMVTFVRYRIGGGPHQIPAFADKPVDEPLPNVFHIARPTPLTLAEPSAAMTKAVLPVSRYQLKFDGCEGLVSRGNPYYEYVGDFEI